MRSSTSLLSFLLVVPASPSPAETAPGPAPPRRPKPAALDLRVRKERDLPPNLGTRAAIAVELKLADGRAYELYDHGALEKVSDELHLDTLPDLDEHGAGEVGRR